MKRRQGGSYEDVPDPAETTITIPGNGTMTESNWRKEQEDKYIRNGYAGMAGGSKRRHRKSKSRRVKSHRKSKSRRVKSHRVKSHRVKSRRHPRR